MSDEMDKIKKTLAQHEKRIAALEGKPKPQTRSRKETSIKEFIIEKLPKTDVQRTLVIGYFLEQRRNYPSFNVKDLEDGFREAKERPPKNINLAVIGNITNGHMMEVKEKKDEKKSWTLTNSGVVFVDSNFEVIQ
ncbi:MAG: hypothetical protein JRN15_11215 [Nitrososphaerota archaeon]|nr:hypothetical protein [Nitrososphaerota archaeon]